MNHIVHKTCRKYNHEDNILMCMLEIITSITLKGWDVNVVRMV